MRKNKTAVVAGLFLLSLVGVATTGRTEEAKNSGSTSFWEKTKVTGQFDASYNWNFNNPALGSAATAFDGSLNNTIRVFDNKADDFNINLAEIAIENSPADWVKFRTDLDFGEDVAVVDATKGGVIGTDEFGLQQAYAELTAPIGKGLTFKAGHFVTLMGYEVIESSANWNTSRSILFGFAIPFTHTGVLMTYPFSDKFSGTIGVVNGWDLVSDNNKGKTGIGQLVYKATDTLTLSLQGTFGPEQAASDSNFRELADFVATWAPNEAWTFGLNYDWGREKGLATCFGNTCWQGGALYAHYKPFDFLGLTLRGEFFQDDGSRLALGAHATVGEGTGTVHFYLGDGWETRLEVRHDQADRAMFARSTGKAARKFQDTASVELVYAF